MSGRIRLAAVDPMALSADGAMTSVGVDQRMELATLELARLDADGHACRGPGGARSSTDFTDFARRRGGH